MEDDISQVAKVSFALMLTSGIVMFVLTMMTIVRSAVGQPVATPEIDLSLLPTVGRVTAAIALLGIGVFTAVKCALKLKETACSDYYSYMHAKVRIAGVTFHGIRRALKYFDIAENAFIDWKNWMRLNGFKITDNPETHLLMFFDGYMKAFEDKTESSEVVDVSRHEYKTILLSSMI